MSFDSLGLHPEIMRAVIDVGYTEPTPVQARAIPVVMSGRDVMAGAQTGTGKTAAFTLPVLHKLQPYANTSASPARHPVRALILTPTRELCDQVFASVNAYGKYLPLRATAVFGGVDMDPQIAELRRGVEILVATPGRLLDHVQSKTVNLSQVEMLVLDEADRMLDMGFIYDIRRIIGLLPTARQTLLFSATFAPEIKRLSEDFMRSPELIEVARRNATNESVTQVLHPVEVGRKRALLAHLIRSHEMSQVIVFCRTKLGAERLSRELKRDGLEVESIHGDKAQAARLATLAAFKEGKVRVLVATDVAARGLDIEELPFVVNYELPTSPEDYVHRIGRTGRAGALGVAISLVAPEEDKPLALIRKMTGKPLELVPVPGYSPGTAPLPREESRNGRSEREGRSREVQRSDSQRNEGRRQEGRERADRSDRSRQPALGGAVSYDDIPAMPLIRGRENSSREVPALLLPPRYRVAPPPSSGRG
ncbi:DEAD/DEAH box helicase [Chitinimonas lacunae]|uniref:DEAD/DEAH box helicase n=1 Tax=Chitinimonas lacunae TaxID=1963018 RepID=A0ABV8MLB0_9NEIS